MNVEVGSILKYFYDLFPNQVYTDELPQGFKKPSLYFPPVQATDAGDTNMTFLKAYTLNVKLFHDNSRTANAEAERIADTLRRERSVLPIMSEDGQPSGEYLRINRIETRVGESGIAFIILSWNSRYHYTQEKAPSLEFVEMNSGVKG